MISKQEILDHINLYYGECLSNIHIFKLSIIDEIYNISLEIEPSKNDNQHISEKYYIKLIVEEYIDKINLYYDRVEKFNKLSQLKLPEQRSPEWFEMRRDKLTASSFATALGEDHYNSKFKLIHDKLTNAPHISNIHTEWGTKYEEIATLFYQLITRTNVVEFGMIPHPDFPIFGASPDGICDGSGPMEYTARMLEIKCPTRREFWMKRNKSKWMPHHYWMQMQGQMEVCDLDECDFLQVKLEEYKNEEEYKSDILDLSQPLTHEYPNVPGYDTTINGKTKDNLPKGCTISYKKDGEEKLSYLYPKLLLSYEESMEWIQDNIKTGINIQEIKWWKITRYEIDLVLRDKKWWNSVVPKVMSFYDHYVYYQTHMDELEEKVKQTDKSKEIVIEVPPPEFALCDSSDEENIKNQDEENIKNQDEKKDIVLSEYVNNDLPEFAL